MRKQLVTIGSSMGAVAFLFVLLGLYRPQEATPLRDLSPQSSYSGPSASLLGPNLGGLIYQDFEGSNTGWLGYCNSSARLSQAGEPAHSGVYSWRTIGTCPWHTTFVRYKNDGAEAWHTDLRRDNNDRLTFWIYALPEGDGGGTDNNVSVTFYDHGNYHTNGFEVWTTNKAHYAQWTKLTILFDQLPDALNLRDIDKLEFKNYWPGAYYLDDIQAVREDRFYQAFEPIKRSLPVTNTSEFGWCWNAVTDGGCRLSAEGEPVHEGEHSWKFQLDNYWGGAGIKSEQEYLVTRTITTTTGTQSPWYVDLDPEHNDRLQFWVYALPSNGVDINLNVQFFDWGAYYTSPVNYWTNQTAIYGQWTQLTVFFSDVLKLAPDLNLNDINKLQFQMYWPGTYYLDDIKAASSVPHWDSLRDNILAWASDYPLNHYVLQENTTDVLSDTQWLTVSAGTNLTYTIPHVTRAWYRVRAEEVQDNNHEVPFVSAWSPTLEYFPNVVLDKARLDQESKLAWTNLPQAITYEVQSAPASTGPWSGYYSGAYPALPLTATVNTWYRARAVNGAETSAWSAPQRKPAAIEQDFIRAVGTTLRKENGAGDSVILRGVNLGGYFVIEPWMNSWNVTNSSLVDDYSIRQVLRERFPVTGTALLTQTYREAFLTEADFDLIQRMGLNFVRLPIYYLDFQDENGDPLPDRFNQLDWIVNTCADRGLYALIDLHGAPGSQSVEAHTGRKDYNLLFTDTVTGALFQDQTVALWEDIAAHYKNSPTVVGYDLLNEPTGAISTTQLWNFYDRLYDAVRAIDSRHIVMMEGTWDWDTLPSPSDYGWENIVYQFHYYYACDKSQGKCPPERAYEDFVQDHKNFIDSKITMASGCRYFQCQAPVMIGEFNAFDAREAWDYYLAKFNEQGWSWALWSYKFSGPAQWGLLTGQNQLVSDRPVFSEDSYDLLRAKLSKPFDSITHYAVNHSLVDLVKAYATAPYSLPAASIVQTVTPAQPVTPGDELTYTLVISTAPGASVALYDRLMGTTFSRFVTQPAGIIHDNGFITGTMAITPSSQMTVAFVALANGATGISNHACFYLLDLPNASCVCSNEAKTFTLLMLPGRVALEKRGVSGDPRWITPLYRVSSSGVVTGWVRLYQPGTSTLKGVYSATTDATGRFTVTLSGMLPGVYDAQVKGANTLSNKRLNVSLPATGEFDFGTLLVGDANGDDRVNGGDVSYMIPSFTKCAADPAFRPYADTNNNGCVNGADVSALIPNFTKAGPIIVTPTLMSLNAARFAARTPQVGASLLLSPTNPAVQAGDVFTLGIVFDTGTGSADTVDAHLDFDPASLEVVDAAGVSGITIEPNTTALAQRHLQYGQQHNGADRLFGFQDDGASIERSAPRGHYSIPRPSSGLGQWCNLRPQRRAVE